MTIPTRPFFKTGGWGSPKIDIRDPNLMLYLPLWRPSGDMTGSPIYDYKSRQSCTVTGATWGYQGRTFVGASNHVIATPDIALTGAFTILFWANRTGNASLDYVLSAADGTARIGYDSGANTVWVRYITTIQKTYATTTGAFQFFAYMRDSSNVCYASINGGAENTMFSGAAQSGTITFNQIGRAAASTGSFTGTAGDVIIYSRRLLVPEYLKAHLSTKWRYK